MFEVPLHLLIQFWYVILTASEILLKLPVRGKGEENLIFFPCLIFFADKLALRGRREHALPSSSLPILVHRKSHSIRVLTFLSINDGFAKVISV